ncbi:MAG: STAS domain-containing protein [Cyanobacteriota bacterium]|nr:STAS domain-containing protein [Cyanobacteriota bacterium]
MNVLLRPQRNLDIKGASVLQQKVESLLPIAENASWAIDLIEVNAIDHYGLTALVEIRKKARENGCRLYLFNLKQPVRDLLEITGLDKEFKILESLDIAFSSKIRLVLC